MKALVVDDDASILIYVKLLLLKNDLEVITCPNVSEAMEILSKETINIVITDWLMPEKTGIELIQWIRTQAVHQNYIYTIVLTAKTLNEDIIDAFNEGADDYITKPIIAKELHVRVSAAKRVIELEQKLNERQDELKQANDLISKHYLAIQKEIKAAQKIQESLLPSTISSDLSIDIQWQFMPATDLAGDLLSFHKLNEEHLGFYLLDVVGHGVPAALLSFYLHKTILSKSHEVKEQANLKSAAINKPSQLISELNKEFSFDNDDMLYFTIIYGTLNTLTGEGVFCQAGHPYPLIYRQNGNVEAIGQGGYPVGLLENASYQDIDFKLNPKDTLILYSDGLTECEHHLNNELYGQERLQEQCHLLNKLSQTEVIQEIVESLKNWTDSDEPAFKDDVSIMTIQQQ